MSEYAPPSGSRFPMLDGPEIDDQTAREIYRVYACLYGEIQTLDRIRQRGGFGWAEVKHFWDKHASKKARRLCRCANNSSTGPEARQ